MNIGDYVEAAFWLTGMEPEHKLEAIKSLLRQSAEEGAASEGVVLGPLGFEEMRPEEDRVPPVPDHIHGPDVRLLVASTEVVAFAPRAPKPTPFVDDLDHDDLCRLRALTRRVYRKTYPGQPQLNDVQCDHLIEELGPQAALKTLREMH